MITIEKRIVVDEQGNPQGVLISWEDYQMIEEMLGLDLEETVTEQLRAARADRARGDSDAYVDLAEI